MSHHMFGKCPSHLAQLHTNQYPTTGVTTVQQGIAEMVTGACRQVILMDRHMAGPLDGLWPAVAAGAGFTALTSSLQSSHAGLPLAAGEFSWLLHVCLLALPAWLAFVLQSLYCEAGRVAVSVMLSV